MSRLTSLLLALFSLTSGILLLLHSLSAPRWISGCVSFASLLIDEKPGHFFTGSDPAHKIKSGPAEKSGYMDEQVFQEKDWLNTKLRDKRICFTQGLFTSCVFGDAFLQFGNYHACIERNDQEKKQKDPSMIAVPALIVSTCASCSSFVALLVALRVLCSTGCCRTIDVIRYVTSVVTFLSGTAILVGLLPIVVLTISYSSNTTNFYNDMVDRIGAAYFFNMKVNWAVPEGDLSGAQAWARNIVANVISLGLDRDFFLALGAGICFYLGCASLLLRSTTKQMDKYPDYETNKQS